MTQEAIEQSAPPEKPCSKCGKIKPLEEFPKCGGKYHRGDCRACNTARVRAWQARNPERNREHRKRQCARAAAARKLMEAAERSGGGLDTMRRLLVETPPGLNTENERLAYFRGLMAGVKRNKEETERFDRLKDLPHRIASEASQKAGIGYEEAVSAAYEGLLEFLRGNMREFKNLEHERKCAAKKIRWYISDYKRSDGPVDRNGNPRWVGSQEPVFDDGSSKLPELAESAEDYKLDENDLWTKIQERLSTRSDRGGRLESILHWRIQGVTMKECGRRLGVTEARISQILKEEGPWLEGNILPLCGDLVLAS